MRKNKEAIERVKRALRILERAKHGGDASGLDGDGPLNEWFAMGAAKENLKVALQAMNEKRSYKTHMLHGRSASLCGTRPSGSLILNTSTDEEEVDCRICLYHLGRYIPLAKKGEAAHECASLSNAERTSNSKIQPALDFVQRVATYFDYTHDDVDEIEILKALQIEAKAIYGDGYSPVDFSGFSQ